MGHREAYRANLRMFDALMQMVRASENFGGSAVIVAASGNESRVDQDPKFRIAASLPAAAEGVISVGALRPDGSGFGMAPFSNIFPQVGAGRRYPLGQGWRRTSLAFRNEHGLPPHVAGVAALWWHSIKAAWPDQTEGDECHRPAPRHGARQCLRRRHGADDRGVGIVTAP